MELKIKKVITVIAFTGFGFGIFGGNVGLVFADISGGSWDKDNSYTPLASLPGTTNSNGNVTIDTYIPGIFNLAIGIAGVLAVLMIIIGGVEYMTTDAIGGKEEGKERISNALKGLLLVLVSWILLYTINPKLTVFDLRAPQTVSTQTSNGGTTGYTGK
ncbi:MAG: hypothetical protein KGJ58_01015 [Patescibacteria group bacterium]|nr:hypothetical protein [Patescibacteria group bacterium]MDE1988181.1 hypothetical protein [Patescibacteria group bacterium]MDE2218021.1 hypothetical protein [Patescibacteria group bacterium]